MKNVNMELASFDADCINEASDCVDDILPLYI